MGYLERRFHGWAIKGMVFTEAMRGIGDMGGLGGLIGDWIILLRDPESFHEEVAPNSVTRLVMAMAATT